MLFTASRTGDYRILTAAEDLNIYTDLSELLDFTRSALAEGDRHIAVCFTPSSYLLSRSMAILVKCIEMVNDEGGTFAILDPSEQILDFLAVVDSEHRIRIFRSRSDLSAPHVTQEA